MILIEDPPRVFSPEVGIAVRRCPPQVSVQDLGGILVEGGLGAGVVGEEIGEGFQIVEEVRVGDVAAGQVLKERGESSSRCERQKR